MYCDNTPVDQMRDERIKCIESKCRNRSVEENLRVWEEMKKGSEEGLQYAVRFKLNMKVRRCGGVLPALMCLPSCCSCYSCCCCCCLLLLVLD